MIDPETDSIRDAYLTLLKLTLTRAGFPERYRPIAATSSNLKRRANAALQGVLRSRGFELVHLADHDPTLRELGKDWPPEAETMIGLKRLDNIERCIVDVLRDNVHGDLVETGVWRGGATIFMRGVLLAYRVDDRVVWAADSFAGLPPPNAALYPADSGSTLFTKEVLAVSLEEVQANFKRYGPLDDQVRFLKGWFRDTLPDAPIDRIAVLRLDGDLYESTMDALTSLYARVSPGGFVIVDDYYSNITCQLAIDDFRRETGIVEPTIDIDDDALYWRKAT